MDPAARGAPNPEHGCSRSWPQHLLLHKPLVCVCQHSLTSLCQKKKCLSTTSWYNHCLHKVGTGLCTKSSKSQELGVKGAREGAEHRPARERAKDGGMEASAHTLTSAARGGLGHPPACHCLQHRFSAKGKGSNAGNSHFGGSSLHPHPPCTVGC